MTVQELWTIVERELKEIKQNFNDFRINDFFHLEQKVDKIALKMYIGIGIAITIQMTILILLKILF